MARILVVDDDPAIRKVLRITLTQIDHQVIEAGDGAEGLAKSKGQLDLVVLDIGLPAMDGFEVCRRIRATRDIPILFLTARDDEIDRVLGFELGCDDYVQKPFSPRELQGRVRAILRRSSLGGSASQSLRHGVIELDPARHLCRVDGLEVPLTAREKDLLEHLMRSGGDMQRKDQIITALYGAHSLVSDRTLDSHLRNLRAKLAEAGCAAAIETVHGVGIRMGPCQTG